MKIKDLPPGLQKSLQRLAKERTHDLQFDHLLDQQRGAFCFAGGHGAGDSLMKALAWQETGNWGHYGEKQHHDIGRELFGLDPETTLQFRAADLGFDGCDHELWQDLCRLFGKNPGQPGPLTDPWEPADGIKLWKRQEKKVQAGEPPTSPIYGEWLPRALRHHRQPAVQRGRGI